MGRSAGGGVGRVPILPPVGPRCAWRGAAVSGSVCQFRVCSCVLGQCTRSVGNAPLLFGCSAPYRVQRHVTGTAPPCLWRLSGLRGSSGLELSSAWTVFRVGSLRRLMLWFLRNVARNSPTCISNVEITSLEFCGFLDTYEKLGYPNYVRLLVDEAPQANSCVRSSSHDTVHDPRDASNTTPTPHNAKSQKRGQPAVNRSPPSVSLRS